MFRSVVLFAILVMVFSAVAPVLAQEGRPYTTTDPASPEGRTIHDLYKLIFWMGVVVFIFVQFLIVWSANLPPEVAWYFARGGWVGRARRRSSHVPVRADHD